MLGKGRESEHGPEEVSEWRFREGRGVESGVLKKDGVLGEGEEKC